jgi:hypothetical protein
VPVQSARPDGADGQTVLWSGEKVEQMEIARGGNTTRTEWEHAYVRTTHSGRAINSYYCDSCCTLFQDCEAVPTVGFEAPPIAVYSSAPRSVPIVKMAAVAFQKFLSSRFEYMKCINNGIDDDAKISSLCTTTTNVIVGQLSGRITFSCDQACAVSNMIKESLLKDDQKSKLQEILLEKTSIEQIVSEDFSPDGSPPKNHPMQTCTSIQNFFKESVWVVLADKSARTEDKLLAVANVFHDLGIVHPCEKLCANVVAIVRYMSVTMPGTGRVDDALQTLRAFKRILKATARATLVAGIVHYPDTPEQLRSSTETIFMSAYRHEVHVPCPLPMDKIAMIYEGSICRSSKSVGVVSKQAAPLALRNGMDASAQLLLSHLTRSMNVGDGIDLPGFKFYGSPHRPPPITEETLRRALTVHAYDENNGRPAVALPPTPSPFSSPGSAMVEASPLGGSAPDEDMGVGTAAVLETDLVLGGGRKALSVTQMSASIREHLNSAKAVSKSASRQPATRKPAKTRKATPAKTKKATACAMKVLKKKRLQSLRSQGVLFRKNQKTSQL